ncbi:hypothetical protein EFR84_11670 [Rhizobium chutanense]|uniref:Uncharacterized protein n=1 Tax=Rhizobium chutanense TaxID=2035448 RepID=A0A3S0QHS7_9HYPH|nr:hypothetical protein EFR84_11670 [Rhizobium chutanense]
MRQLRIPPRIFATVIRMAAGCEQRPFGSPYGSQNSVIASRPASIFVGDFGAHGRPVFSRGSESDIA